jgi:hypothetical protein
MGSLAALDIATNIDITLEQQIEWHLRSNHYPPVPASMVQPCIDAIDAGWEEDWNKEITLPDGVLYKGKTTAPAYAIIEQHHLDAWLMEDEEE